MVGGLQCVVIHVKCDPNRLRGYVAVGGRKWPFPITLASGLYNTLTLYYRTSRDERRFPELIPAAYQQVTEAINPAVGSRYFLPGSPLVQYEPGIICNTSCTTFSFYFFIGLSDVVAQHLGHQACNLTVPGLTAGRGKAV